MRFDSIYIYTLYKVLHFLKQAHAVCFIQGCNFSPISVGSQNVEFNTEFSPSPHHQPLQTITEGLLASPNLLKPPINPNSNPLYYTATLLQSDQLQNSKKESDLLPADCRIKSKSLQDPRHVASVTMSCSPTAEAHFSLLSLLAGPPLSTPQDMLPPS